MTFLDVPQLNTNNFVLPNSRVWLLSDFRYAEDFTHNRPFSEAESALLNQAMASVGLNLGDCSILHVISEPCTQVSISKFWNVKGGFTTHGMEEVQALRNQIMSMEPPNVIVPLGEIALQAISSIRSITKHRGSILLADKLSPGIKMVPTISPKVAIRKYLFRYYIQADMKKAFDQADFPDIRLPYRKLLVSPTFQEVMEYLDECKKAPVLSVDIETARNEVSCISFALSPYLCMSIPFYHEWTEDEELQIWLKIASILGDPTIDKIFQNGMFDIYFLLMRNKIITRGYIHDTMIKHNLNYPDFPKSLAFLTSIYTDEPYYKDDGKKWFQEIKAGTAGDVNQFYIYNAKDSAVTFEIDYAVTKDLQTYGNTESYEVSRRLMSPLLFMQAIGIRVDLESLAKCRQDAHIQLKELQAKLDELTGKPLNVNSPKMCINYFYNIKGYTPITKQRRDKATGTRRITLCADDKAMKKLIKKYNSEEARLVQQIRKIKKLISTYFELTLDADNRLRCSFSIPGTNTGRLSSSQTCFGTGQNLQNLPKSFRVFLTTDPGYIGFEIDLSQAEWVATAYISGDSNMIHAIENRLDVHVNTAHLMFDVPEELIKKEDELIGSDTDPDNILKKRKEDLPEILKYHPLTDMSLRQGGKKSNHSFNYGLSPNGFALQYSTELKSAKRCHTLYHSIYPGVRQWHQFVRYQLGKTRTLENLFGRKRRFLDRWNEDLFKAAYSYNPQSSIAQLLNMGLIDIYEQQDTHECLRPLQLLNQVHDSVWFQYPIDKLHLLPDALKFIQGSLQRKIVHQGREFFIRCDCKMGLNFKQMEKIDLDGEDLLSQITTQLDKLHLLPTLSINDLAQSDIEDDDDLPDEEVGDEDI